MNNIQSVPFFGIDRFYKQHAIAMNKIYGSVLSSGKVLMGPEVENFEKKLAHYVGLNHAVSTGSCTDALFFALRALGVKAGDEVILPSFSYIASATPIIRAGAIPVFTDIDPVTLSMSVLDFEKKITPRTKAVIFVHMFGAFSPLKSIAAVAANNRLPLIEDAAHSLGSFYEGDVMAGTIGDVACFSFDPTKVIGAFGTGGALLTNNENIADTVRKMRLHGKNNGDDFEILGYNSRLSTLQAALLDYQLDLIDILINRRRHIAACYNDALKELSDIFPVYMSVENSTYHKYVVISKHRDALEAHLKKNNVACMKHYHKALFEYSLFNDYHYRADNLTVVHDIKNKVLSLPVFPEMTDDEVFYVIDTLKRFF